MPGAGEPARGGLRVCSILSEHPDPEMLISISFIRDSVKCSHLTGTLVFCSGFGGVFGIAYEADRITVNRLICTEMGSRLQLRLLVEERGV